MSSIDWTNGARGMTGWYGVQLRKYMYEFHECVHEGCSVGEPFCSKVLSKRKPRFVKLDSGLGWRSEDGMLGIQPKKHVA